MSKFKVGDRIKCVKEAEVKAWPCSVPVGALATINEAQFFGNWSLSFDDYGQMKLNSPNSRLAVKKNVVDDCFELVTQKSTGHSFMPPITTPMKIDITWTPVSDEQAIGRTNRPSAWPVQCHKCGETVNEIDVAKDGRVTCWQCGEKYS